jgi:hypothetical protein
MKVEEGCPDPEADIWKTGKLYFKGPRPADSRKALNCQN